MPVLLSRRKPDHIAGMDLLNRTALALHPTATDSDNEGLAKRMSMPCGSSTGFEGDASAGRARRSACLKQGIDAHGARKPIGGSFAG